MLLFQNNVSIYINSYYNLGVLDGSVNPTIANYSETISIGISGVTINAEIGKTYAIAIGGFSNNLNSPGVSGCDVFIQQLSYNGSGWQLTNDVTSTSYGYVYFAIVKATNTVISFSPQGGYWNRGRALVFQID